MNTLKSHVTIIVVLSIMTMTGCINPEQATNRQISTGVFNKKYKQDHVLTVNEILNIGLTNKARNRKMNVVGEINLRNSSGSTFMGHLEGSYGGTIFLKSINYNIPIGGIADFPFNETLYTQVSNGKHLVLQLIPNTPSTSVANIVIQQRSKIKVTLKLN